MSLMGSLPYSTLEVIAAILLAILGLIFALVARAINEKGVYSVDKNGVWVFSWVMLTACLGCLWAFGMGLWFPAGVSGPLEFWIPLGCAVLASLLTYKIAGFWLR